MELYDYHIIQVDRVYDDRPTDTGLVSLNKAFYRVEKEMDRYERKLLSGTIVAVPIGYSDKNYMPIDPGYPNPKIFIGHDAIQLQRNRGMDWGNEKYHPGLKDRIDFLTIADYGALIDAKVGEKVYFHPSVTEAENMISEGQYKMAVHELICVVGDTIRPQGGYVLVEGVLEDDQELTSGTGLQIKTEKEHHLLEAIVLHARPEAQVKPADFILYQENANWEVIIEGKKLFAMLEEDCMMRKIVHG